LKLVNGTQEDADANRPQTGAILISQAQLAALFDLIFIHLLMAQHSQ